MTILVFVSSRNYEQTSGRLCRVLSLGEAEKPEWSSDPQQTRGGSPMLGWCWPNVYDAGPTSTPHWANADRALQNQSIKSLSGLSSAVLQSPSFPDTLTQFWFNVEPALQSETSLDLQSHQRLIQILAYIYFIKGDWSANRLIQILTNI